MGPAGDRARPRKRGDMPGLSVQHGLAPVVLMALACDRQPSASQHDADFDELRQSTFVPAPDFGGGTIVDCDLFQQDCPTGEKCMPWGNDGGAAWNSTRCAPVAAAPGAPGDPCTVEGSAVSGIDDCERGAMCLELDANNHGTCHALVSGSRTNPMCLDKFGPPELASGGAFNRCRLSCSPLESSCPDGQGCYYKSALYHEGGLFGCAHDGSGAIGNTGDACEFVQGCDNGHACVAGRLVPGCESPGCCAPHCDLDAPACPEGTTCQEWWWDHGPPPGQEDVGVCAT